MDPLLDTTLPLASQISIHHPDTGNSGSKQGSALGPLVYSIYITPVFWFTKFDYISTFHPDADSCSQDTVILDDDGESEAKDAIVSTASIQRVVSSSQSFLSHQEPLHTQQGERYHPWYLSRGGGGRRGGSTRNP